MVEYGSYLYIIVDYTKEILMCYISTVEGASWRTCYKMQNRNTEWWSI